MYSYSILCFLIITLVTLSSTTAQLKLPYEFEDGVLVLTDENYKDVARTFDDMLILLYAPWCGQCKKLLPEWDAAAALVHGKYGQTRMVLAKVNVDTHKKIAKYFKIDGVPTIKMVSQKIILGEYSGYQTPEAIFGFVDKKITDKMDASNEMK